MTFGKLRTTPACERPDLLALPTAAAIATIDAEGVFVAEIDPHLADTTAFCEYYKIPMAHSGNCVILKATRGDKEWLAACLVLATTRADVNGLARRTLDARKVSFAPQEEALQATGMEYGGVTPIGLPENMTLLIEAAVIQMDWLVIGSGIRGSKLIVPGKSLKNLPSVIVLEGLGRTPQPERKIDSANSHE